MSCQLINGASTCVLVIIAAPAGGALSAETVIMASKPYSKISVLELERFEIIFTIFFVVLMSRAVRSSRRERSSVLCVPQMNVIAMY